MTMFTPALLFCLPLWAAAFALQTIAVQTEAMRDQEPQVADDETCPTRWAAMPFTPPPVHTV